MANRLFTLLLLIISQTLVGQDTTIIDLNSYKETSVAMGYNYNFADPNEKNFHLIEARIQKQWYHERHPFFTHLSAGLDVGITTNTFLTGPRIGGIVGFSMLFLGINLAYYTDFDEGTLRLIPMIGIGFHQFRLSINPHIRISNRDYEPINRGHLNVTIKLFKLNREKLE